LSAEEHLVGLATVQEPEDEDEGEGEGEGEGEESMPEAEVDASQTPAAGDQTDD